MRYRVNKRPGAIAVLVAVCLTVILSITAIVLDGGLLLDDEEQVQAAADAAALAGAADLFNNWGTNAGSDPKGTAKASALLNASANSYTNDGVTSTVTVNIPPKSGNFKNKTGYVEVSIQYNQTRGLSSIFGSGTLPVTARAVAYGNPGNIGILILDPTEQGALEIRGNVNVQNGGALWSNSNNTTPNDSASQGATGSVYVGSGCTLTAGSINVRDSIVADGSVVYQNTDGTTNASGKAAKFTTSQPDPLASITEPTKTGLTTRADQNITTNTTLQPGVYNNITIANGSGSWSWSWVTWSFTYTPPTSPTVTLAPGLYYIDSGGSFSLNGGSITGTGVMIFNNTGNDSVFGWSNPAQGTINLTPPSINSDGTDTGGTWPTGTTATTYAGISMWVPRSETDEVHFQSNSNATISGTWYAAKSEFDIRANGSSVVFNIGNYICDLGEWNQKIGGDANTGTGTININPGTAAATQRPTLVE